MQTILLRSGLLAWRGVSALGHPGKFKVWLYRDSLSLFLSNSFLGTIYCPACCQALINELCQLADLQIHLWSKAIRSPFQASYPVSARIRGKVVH